VTLVSILWVNVDIDRFRPLACGGVLVLVFFRFVLFRIETFFVCIFNLRVDINNLLGRDLSQLMN
jgi:hypothetical protein